ncbi:hypothetical protein M8C21_009731, partial [Ambrosia artemisiifolia]
GYGYVGQFFRLNKIPSPDDNYSLEKLYYSSARSLSRSHTPTDTVQEPLLDGHVSRQSPPALETNTMLCVLFSLCRAAHRTRFENEGISIGIVSAIAAPASIKVDFGGNRGHVGTVLMPQRKNAVALCLTTVKNKDKMEFNSFLEGIKAKFNDKYDGLKNIWVVE